MTKQVTQQITQQITRRKQWLLIGITLAWSLILLIIAWSILPKQSPAPRQHHHWLWAGLLPNELPPTVLSRALPTRLYIYQGNIERANNHYFFVSKGIQPSPLPTGINSIVLVLRMHHLPTPDSLIDVYQQRKAHWAEHSVSVVGLQLDYDSPSAKLSAYARHLRAVREKLHAVHPNAEFSITGLGSWMVDTDSETLTSLHSSVDFVAYQLYRHRTPIKHLGRYLTKLENLSHPFRTGLLSQQTLPENTKLATNGYWLGHLYFHQK